MDVDAYLKRIGATRPATVDSAALRELHERHLATVPFENLSIHLGQPIELDEDKLVEKIVGGRGGYCYELNGAFAGLLRELGFPVFLQTATGRVTIAGRTLIRTTAAGRTESTLDSDAEVLAAYREHLGIDLDAVPSLP